MFQIGILGLFTKDVIKVLLHTDMLLRAGKAVIANLERGNGLTVSDTILRRDSGLP